MVPFRLRIGLLMDYNPWIGQKTPVFTTPVFETGQNGFAGTAYQTPRRVRY
jgi:hypothetical protein